MAKKLKLNQEEGSANSPVSYKIINCVEAIQSVPFINDNGEIEYLNLRIQGKGGQVPPVLAQTAITDQMRSLQKKKLIRLEKVEA